MSLMAVGNRLLRRRVFRGIIGNFLLHFRHGGSRLLRPRVPCHKKKRREQSKVQRHYAYSLDPSQKPTSPVAWHDLYKIELRTAYSYDDLFSFLPTTSSRLVPRSLSITIAALRPGWPVTDPPGAVVPPV